VAALSRDVTHATAVPFQARIREEHRAAESETNASVGRINLGSADVCRARTPLGWEPMALSISAVVPTWCEGESIHKVVQDCLALADEVVVADADSPDGTAALARDAGARVVSTPKGRGLQLNAGAAEATGDALLFVHADTSVAPAAREVIQRALLDATVVGGNFKLRFLPATRSARIYSVANDLPRRWLHIYYGDSCIFVRRAVFGELGGFAEIPLFEDYDFVERLEALGRTYYATEVEAASSARRFVERPLRTLALWSAL
jgi:glycosyltransferase involved in cell wall biosynthesis